MKITKKQTASENLGYDDDNYFFDIPKVAPLQDEENTQKRQSDNKYLEYPNLRENLISQIWLSPKKEKESMKVSKKKESALPQKRNTDKLQASLKAKIPILVRTQNSLSKTFRFMLKFSQKDT